MNKIDFEKNKNEKVVFQSIDAVNDQSEQCAHLLAQISKNMVENSADFEDAKWGKLINEIDNYTGHNINFKSIITKF